jgi:hypothetical protein
VDTLLQDVRFAFRQLRRTPAFTVAAIACLALGIPRYVSGSSTFSYTVRSPIRLKAWKMNPIWRLRTRARSEAVMELLRELHQGGATICMVTHDPRYARHADRSVHLFDGKVVEERQLSAVG